MSSTHTARRPASPSTGWVGIASFHPLVTRFLCDLLGKSRKFHQFATQAQPTKLDGYLGGQCPAVVVVDTVFADNSSARTVAQEVRAKFPASKLVALASCREEHVIELLQVGFSAVVQITDKFDCDIASAIAAVLSGSIWVPESVIRDYSKLVQDTLEMRLARDRLLTARETQILELVLWGRSNKEIASDLAIGERTVKFHLSNILSKVGVERRRELVRVFGWPHQSSGRALVAAPPKLEGRLSYGQGPDLSL